MASIDPRPLRPEETGSIPFDSRHGHTNGAGQTVPIWSASRLKQWLSCPRKGWLTRGLYAKEEERQREDLDARVQGNLLHKVHHQLIEQLPSELEAAPACSLGSMARHYSLVDFLDGLDTSAPLK